MTSAIFALISGRVKWRDDAANAHIMPVICPFIAGASGDIRQFHRVISARCAIFAGGDALMTCSLQVMISGHDDRHGIIAAMEIRRNDFAGGADDYAASMPGR